MSDALEHVRYSCGIAGEEVANYVDQLQAKVTELEEELLKTKMDLLTSYGESEELLGRIAELEAEVERLKRTNSSYANLTKAQESQLTNLRQRLYQLKGADSAIDSERQANCDLTEQLAAEQLNNKRLRKALEAVIKVHGYESGIPVEAISTPASTEALDKYVAEKVKDAESRTGNQSPCYTIARDMAVRMWEKHYKTDTPNWEPLDDFMGVLSQISNMLTGLGNVEKITKQRDLAVEALEKIAGRRIFSDSLAGSAGIAEMTLDIIKESEGK